MEKLLPSFLQNADNIYRTKYYIVKQMLGIQESDAENNQVISNSDMPTGLEGSA